VATASNDIDKILRRMAEIRRELHEDMQGVVAGAEAVTDWRRYVRLYPWAAVGAAIAIGYLVVPRRRRSVSEVVDRVVPRVAEAVRVETPSEKKVEVKKERKAGLLGALGGMIMPVIVRAGQGYVSQFLERWIAQQAAAQMAMGAAMGMPPGGPASGQPGQARPGGPQAGPGRPGPR